MFLGFVWSQSYMITGSAKNIYCLNLYLFEQIKVSICEDQIWLDVLKICYITSKLQWSNPKHTFCLWKLGEDIHQSIIEFLVFLVKDFDSRSLTISAQSLLGALALLSFTGACSSANNSSLVMLAWPPCKAMELPCFFSMAVAIVLTW